MTTGQRAKEGVSRKNLIVVFALVFMPLIAVSLSVMALTKVYQNTQGADAFYRADETSQYELKRLSAMMNFRLNAIREELFHLYIEQSNTVPGDSQTVTELQKQRALFMRRDYIGAVGIVLQAQVFKYFVHENSIVPEGMPQTEPLLNYFKSVAAKTTGNFYIEKTDLGQFTSVNPNIVRSTDWYTVALPMKDDAGKDMIFAGIFKRDYIFNFCKYFSESFGRITTSSYIVDDAGKVICHSQPRYEGQLVTDRDFYRKVLPAVKDNVNITARYENLVSEPVVGVIRKIVPGGFLFFSESTETLPWGLPVPARDLSIALAVVSIITFTAVFLLAKKMGGLVFSNTKTVMAKEFDDIEKELNEMKSTVLSVQHDQSVIVKFQLQASNVKDRANLIAAFVESASTIVSEDAPIPTGFFAYDPKLKSLVAVNALNGWTLDQLKKANTPIADATAPFKGHDLLFAAMAPKLGSEDFKIQPVEFSNRMLGVLVMNGEKSFKPQLNREVLMQLCLIFSATYVALEGGGK